MHEGKGIEKAKRLISRERWYRIAETGEAREIQARIAKINRVRAAALDSHLRGDVVHEGIVAQNLNAASAVVYVRVVDETWRPVLREAEVEILIARGLRAAHLRETAERVGA